MLRPAPAMLPPGCTLCQAGSLPRAPLAHASALFTSADRAEPQITAEKAEARDSPAACKHSLAAPGEMQAATGLSSLVTLPHSEIMLSKRGIFKEGELQRQRHSSETPHQSFQTYIPADVLPSPSPRRLGSSRGRSSKRRASEMNGKWWGTGGGTHRAGAAGGRRGCRRASLWARAGCGAGELRFAEGGLRED